MMKVAELAMDDKMRDLNNGPIPTTISSLLCILSGVIRTDREIVLNQSHNSCN